MAHVEMKDIVEFAKTRGFVYQGSEIYGGLANAWDYGPYGSLLKENIKNAWLREFVQKRTDMVTLDSAILMNPNVWVASGHVGGFSDPLIDDKNTKERFRADKLLEDCIELKEQELGDRSKVEQYFSATYHVNNLVPESWTLEQQASVMRGEKVKNPNTGEPGDWTDVRKFNLMYKTSQGVTEDSSATIYLRPETAQGIFVNFANIARTSRKKVPFGIAQVGKAFRNEITPGNFIFRTREFEQMEIEYFCESESIAPGKHLERHTEWKERCMKFLLETLDIEKESLRFRDHETDELSHYSAATTDIEYRYPFGWGELWGIADRTDFDLKAHMSESKQDLSYFDPYLNTKYVPYVIEPSVGLTRLTLVILLSAYTKVETEEGSRVIMKFKPSIAPIKVAILPVVKKLSAEAMEIYNLLSPHFTCEYDETGAIGKRYYRMDEIGVPFSIAIDSDNYVQGQITVRHRDTGEQEIVKIADLKKYIEEKIG